MAAEAGAARRAPPGGAVAPATHLHADMSGGELADAIAREASRRGLPIQRFVSQLSPNPKAWLAQLRCAMRPKPHTYERITALIRGETVPPPPPNNFQKNGKPSPPKHVASSTIPMEDLPPSVDRDPCPRCGVRADLGCRHRQVPLLVVRSVHG